MKLSILIAALMLMIVCGSVNLAAADYYVIKSRSGMVRIVDHKPQGRAAILEGPFKTREEAEKAVSQSTKNR